MVDEGEVRNNVSLRWALLWTLAFVVGCGHRVVGCSSGTTLRTVGESVNNRGTPVSNSREQRMLAAYEVPILTTVGLEDVRLAIETQDDELAAASLTDILGKNEYNEPERTRLYYLLGVIEERRGDGIRARNAFREAAMVSGPLRVDALLHQGTIAVTLRDCGGAKQVLDDVKAYGADVADVASLTAEISLCDGQRNSAIRSYETVIADAKSPRQKARFQIRLAEIRMEGLGKCGEREREDEEGIVTLARQARDAAGTYSPVLQRAARIFASLTCPELDTIASAISDESLDFIEQLLEQRRWSEAKQILSLWESETTSEPKELVNLCRVQFAQGRLAMGGGKTGEAQSRFDWVAEHCEDRERVAKALYWSAGQCDRRGKKADAITRYAELERRFPEHRLADDARLKAAKLYRDLGSEKQYFEMLDGMPDRYPNGDMCQEGLFLMALESMLRRDWAAALTILERATKLGEASGVIGDAERDRLDYFLGRAKLSLGRGDEGTAALRRLVVNRPLSYYMLLAYSVLSRDGGKASDTGIEQGLAVATRQFPEVVGDEGGKDEQLARVIALLAVGDLPVASERMFELSNASDASAFFWKMVELYTQAGAVHTALTMVKGRSDDFRVRWPTENWIPFWQMAYPRPYEAYVRRESTKSNVPESLVYAIMREESEFEPLAVSAANAYGLMQIIIPTAVTVARGTGYVATARSLLRPETNIALGARVLAGLRSRFRGQDALAIAGYNAGPGRPRRWLKERPETPLDVWIEAIEYTETRNYVKRVLSSRAVYRWLYGKAGEKGTVEPLEFELAGP